MITSTIFESAGYFATSRLNSSIVKSIFNFVTVFILQRLLLANINSNYDRVQKNQYIDNATVWLVIYIMLIVILIVMGAKAYRNKNEGLGAMCERLASLFAVFAVIGVLATGVYYTSARSDYASASARVELLADNPSPEAVGEKADAAERKRMATYWFAWWLIL